MAIQQCSFLPPRQMVFGSLSILWISLAGCSGTDANTPGQTAVGGDVGTTVGGASSGGAENGGNPVSGGTSTGTAKGGASSGGNAAGGAAMGGNAAAGIGGVAPTSGGSGGMVATGGIGVGGKAAGGVASGGKAAGGAASGGKAAGGAASGGKAAGGAASGGASVSAGGTAGVSTADQFVAAHNAVRSAVTEPAGYSGTWVPIPNVTWSETVAATAQAWAENLATTQNCGLVHATGTGYGENLAMGTRLTPAQAVNMWAGEENLYTWSATYSKADFDAGSGHYTQVVWRKSTQIGCGVATCSNNRVVICCRYSPPGNYIGQAVY